MTCLKCGSEKVNIQIVQTGAKTRERRRGCLWTLGRWTLILCTCGLWLLVGKSKGKHKTKIEHKKIALCQNCGFEWDVDNPPKKLPQVYKTPAE